MNTLPDDDCFLFVIKTDSYAENFEREMCGYMTGEIGDCNVGDNEVEMFITDYPGNTDFEVIVTRFPDKHGYCCPVTVCGDEYNDVAIFLETRPTDEQLVLMRERARKFAEMTNPQDGKHNCITILGFELHEYTIIRNDRTEKTWENNE